MNVRQLQPARFTNAEFERLVRSGGFGDARVELRRGLIRKMNAQHVPHARVKELLASAIKEGVGAAGLPWLVYQEVSVDFGRGFEPLPDIVVFDPTTMSLEIDGPLPASAARLVVEVADTTLADDLGEKLEDYAQGALAEYWVADVRGRIILRHAVLSTTTYTRREPAKFGEAFALLTHPKFRVDTAALA